MNISFSTQFIQKKNTMNFLLLDNIIFLQANQILFQSGNALPMLIQMIQCEL